MANHRDHHWQRGLPQAEVLRLVLLPAEEPDKIMAMSEDEQTNYVMEILIELLNRKLADPQYDPEEEVVVHYGPMEGQEGVYGCTEAEGKKLGEKLFSVSAQ